MMRESKIKEAFKKVKEDMFVLSKQMDDLKQKTKTASSKKDNFDSKKFDNFVKNVENELNALNLFTREFDDKLKHLSLQLNQVTNEQKKIEEKSLQNQSSTQNNKIDIELIDERFEELSEILNEKISLETASIKLEFTEEIAKIYDKVFNEILDLKNDMNKIEKKSNKKESKKEEDVKKEVTKKSTKKESKKEEQKKIKKEEKIDEELYPTRDEGKLKKIAKWLFVDEEEEDEMNNIKDQIKKDSKKKDKDDLY